MRLLLIDNYDSYTYNLYQLLAQVCGPQVTVLVNDDDQLTTLDPGAFDALVISPGPGRPQHATDLGWCYDVLSSHPQLPVLGVCLGHQALAYESGARVLQGTPRHGHLSQLRHVGAGLFDGLPQGFTVTRYHSLQVAEPLPAPLVATAWAEDGVVMAVRHRILPRWGVQFHPESVATQQGAALVANFARLVARQRSMPWRPAATAPPGQCRAPGQSGPPGQNGPPGQSGPALLTPSGRPRRKPDRRSRPKLQVSVATIDRALDGPAVFGELYADSPYAFWLDSSKGGAGGGRFSFLGDASGPASEVLTYHVGATTVQVRRGTEVSRTPGTIFDVLERRLADLSICADSLPFDLTGGYVGYFGYEAKANLGGSNAHVSPTPDALWMLADRLVVIDHRDRVSYVLAVHPRTASAAAAARAWLDGIAQRLRRLGPITAEDLPGEERSAASAEQLAAGVRLGRDRDQYIADIERCIEELRRGESYEICLTNRIHLPPLEDPLAFYAVLRRLNPAPYAAFLRLGEFAVMSSSPERFLRVYRDAMVEARPIKGTAPRSMDPLADEELRASLVSSPKTRAENLMIVDLLRNDLGRVCEVGSVQVPQYLATESYATVHQLVSTIRGRLTPAVGPVGCVRACFPGGSMTGAPKIRTMEIIDRLEGEARGIYSGALGYFGLSGGADLSIVIRTAVATADEVQIGTGGAIVMGSDPAEEFAETTLKAQALLHAYQVVTSRRR